MEVSVVICTYNRDKYLPRTLDSFLNQSAPFESFELVVINNMSTDSTEEVISNFIESKHSITCNVFNELNQGHTYARNRGIKESKGRIISFIDDDAFVHPGYIEGIIESFSNKNILAIGGKIIPKYESGSAPTWMTKFLLPLVAALDLGDKKREFSGAKFPIGANMAFRREVFESYGDFDEQLGRRGTDGLEGGDEKDLFSRLKKNNELIMYCPNVVVDHIIPDKRLQISYVKGLAKGVGSSERKRLAAENQINKTKRFFLEVVKITGSGILAIGYLIKGQSEAALMLLRFRFWVIEGYFSK